MLDEVTVLDPVVAPLNAGIVSVPLSIVSGEEKTLPSETRNGTETEPPLTHTAELVTPQSNRPPRHNVLVVRPQMAADAPSVATAHPVVVQAQPGPW